MNIYTVVWEDNHADTSVYPFTDEHQAIAEARAIVQKYAVYIDYCKEYDCQHIDNRVYHVKYAYGCSVTVTVKKLDEHIKGL